MTSPDEQDQIVTRAVFGISMDDGALMLQLHHYPCLQAPEPANMRCSPTYVLDTANAQALIQGLQRLLASTPPAHPGPDRH